MKKISFLQNVHFSGFVITVSVVCGALAGAATAITTNQSLERYAQALADRERLFSIAQEKPRPLPGTYEEALARVQEVGWNALALLVPASRSANEEFFTEQDASAFGIVLTGDGWILFHEEAFDGMANPVEGGEIWVRGSKYTIETVVEDAFSDFALVKVRASGLSTFAFGLSGEMQGGDLLFALTGTRKVAAISLADARFVQGAIVRPAETLGYEWLLTDEFEGSVPLLNSAGQLVGFSVDADVAVPLHHLRPFIQSTLRGTQLTPAGLGVRGVSVHRVLNLDPRITAIAPHGFYVTSGSAASGVTASSPAALAGIQDKDVIYAVDDVFLNAGRDLSDLLSTYKAGDTADMLILREGTSLEVEVRFGDLRTLR